MDDRKEDWVGKGAGRPPPTPPTGPWHPPQPEAGLSSVWPILAIGLLFAVAVASWALWALSE